MQGAGVRFLASALLVLLDVSCGSHSALLGNAPALSSPVPNAAPLNLPSPALNTLSPAPISSPVSGQSSPAASSGVNGALQLVGFWESWSDTTLPLSSTPAGVTVVDVAFSAALANGTLANAQNTHSLAPGAAAIHARGGNVLISFGGATAASAYANLNVAAFVKDLSGLFAANPGVYDGVDFDDEQDPRNAQTLINVIEATRAAFPNIIITYDAFPPGADAGTGTQGGRSDWQGSDIPVAAAVAQAVSWVNVMDYNIGNWVPSDNPMCVVAQTAANDCRRDIMADFAKIYPKNKLVMGLEVPADDNGIVKMSAADAAAYASWVKANGYHGIMLWDLNRDGGFSAVNAVAASLGT
jgi:chitinase